MFLGGPEGFHIRPSRSTRHGIEFSKTPNPEWEVEAKGPSYVCKQQGPRSHPWNTLVLHCLPRLRQHHGWARLWCALSAHRSVWWSEKVTGNKQLCSRNSQPPPLNMALKVYERVYLVEEDKGTKKVSHRTWDYFTLWCQVLLCIRTEEGVHGRVGADPL